MLAPCQKETHRAYVWAYCTTPFSALKAVVYDFSPSRADEHARNFLGSWNGKLVCDDFAGYKADKKPPSPGCFFSSALCRAPAWAPGSELLAPRVAPAGPRAVKSSAQRAAPAEPRAVKLLAPRMAPAGPQAVTSLACIRVTPGRLRHGRQHGFRGARRASCHRHCKNDPLTPT